MTAYSIWLLEYAYTESCPVGTLVYGRHNEGSAKVPFGYVLIKGLDTTILVDCGYDNRAHGEALGRKSGARRWYPPRAVLAECGVEPEHVDHVVITHAHYDHMGGMRFFPNATFYLQEAELSEWISTISLPQSFEWMMSATDPADVMYAAELAEEKRLVLVRGDLEDFVPGLDLRLAADSHTAGSQYCVVRNDGLHNSKDAYVCAGDLVYVHENLHGGTPEDPKYVPVGYAMGSQRNLLLASEAMMQIVAKDYKRVLAVHEEKMFSIYPSKTTKIGLRIAEIALRNGQSSLVT
ncbi:N-acyl homoserine lactonase family protein [Caballeronia sp. RCC_10]|jgi:glyoxylase-like metal-dependent hydrolase (beta-lactamase superfamily II)|uniref:N-acyl homoserine lactonase family protein n=1 Tax=Caballeronia sp. RCC_10 TaxID=3239227 RepID=UPI003523A582